MAHLIMLNWSKKFYNALNLNIMAKKFENISNNNVRIGGSGLTGLFNSNVTAKEETPSVSNTREVVPTTTRQTFVILVEDLQFIKDVVRTRRMEGEIEFTQKEALHHIIAFYKDAHK